MVRIRRPRPGQLCPQSKPVQSTALRVVEPLEGRALLSVGTGLAGAYFARTNLTLDKFARVDSTINFNWASAHTAAKSLGTDGFSVRWVGRVMPKFSEAYT